MDTVEQTLVDFLYGSIHIQNLRCNHFKTSEALLTNSVWNRYSDEKKILDRFIHEYKTYYKTKANEIKQKLETLKDCEIASFFTYNVDQYMNRYTHRVREVDAYLLALDHKTFDHIAKEKLSYVSDEIDKVFPGFMSDPKLLDNSLKKYKC